MPYLGREDVLKDGSERRFLAALKLINSQKKGCLKNGECSDSILTGVFQCKESLKTKFLHKGFSIFEFNRNIKDGAKEAAKLQINSTEDKERIEEYFLFFKGCVQQVCYKSIKQWISWKFFYGRTFFTCR
jgi:hypothetical protein